MSNHITAGADGLNERKETVTRPPKQGTRFKGNEAMARKLNGYEKAAILMMTLGEDLASEIIKNLDPHAVRMVSAAMAKASDVSKEEIDAVLADFAEKTATGGAGLKMEGKEYAQKVLKKSFGSEKAGQVMDNFSETEENEGLETLKWMDPKIIATILREEHPQTITLILTYFNPDQSSKVLINLPEALRGDVMFRMATLEEIPPGVMKEVSAAIQSRLSQTIRTAGRKVGGVKMVADILNNMDQSFEKNSLEELSSKNPDLAERIRGLMFVFDDLAQLDDRSVQELLKDINKEYLAVALKGAKEEIKEKFYKNMSERAVQLLKDDMEARGPMKVSEVEKIQQDILKVARRLGEEGRIVLGGKNGAEALV
ncbi:MAG: flagellar motor switch protein FliG [Candidatus Manganitrophaceae bacterium]|nr:MAG: flagellar motor switch protein FliG [Candidatus Manganitrophaceae bacterium]